MSDRPTLYRFKSPDYERTAVRAGAVVPVERCEHGNIDPHELSDLFRPIRNDRKYHYHGTFDVAEDGSLLDPYGIGEGEFRLVPVEPDRTFTVGYEKGAWISDDIGVLPKGRYAIVRLDDE